MQELLSSILRGTIHASDKLPAATCVQVYIVALDSGLKAFPENLEIRHSNLEVASAREIIIITVYNHQQGNKRENI